MPFPSVCPHVRAEEAVKWFRVDQPSVAFSGSAHLVGPCWVAGRRSASGTHCRRRLRARLCSHIFLCSGESLPPPPPQRFSAFSWDEL